MKFFLVVFALFAVIKYSQTFDLQAEEKAIRDECVKSEKLDLIKVMKAIEDVQYPNDKNFKCFLKCVMLKKNLMTASGEFLVDNLKKDKIPFITITPEKASAIVDTCTATKSADACETAYEFGKCFSQQLMTSLTL